MKSGKKVIRVALAILCMVSMLFISEYQKVEVYAASGYGFIFLSAYEKTLKIGMITGSRKETTACLYVSVTKMKDIKGS